MTARRPRRGRPQDRGGGVVLVLGLVAVALGVAFALTALGAAAVARHRADAVADLAALAAAAPETADCARAAGVAARSDAALLSCGVRSDGSVVVEVTVALPGWLDRLAGAARPVGRARAGRPGDRVDQPSGAVWATSRHAEYRRGPRSSGEARRVRRGSAGSD